ncbi:ATP-binding protein [Micromonospora sp. CPCC 205371]|nr:ATP-binding protein [Micromonospora sp. CPCC 205371]
MDTRSRAAQTPPNPSKAMTATPAPAPTIVDTLAYPISPDYVKSWTPVRALCELIANALDEDPGARVGWADGVLTIADDGPGIPEEGLILGYSSKTAEQIGQFGEGKKLAALVLARSPEIGAVHCETVGYGFIPTVERRRLLGGQIPSRSAQGAEVLVYNLYRTDRAQGTVITVACSRALAQEAIGRFRALAEPGYRPPAPPGVCVLDGKPGRVWIGGVLVSTVDGFRASYDLPLADKALQNRDRTVIEAGALRDAVRAILAESQDQQVIDRFAAHVLAGGKLREPEQFFGQVVQARARAAWRTWARAHLPAQTYYTTAGSEEAALDLVDLGYTEVAARGLGQYEQRAVMELLGVEVAKARQTRHYDRTRGKTTWVAERSLTPAERAVLADARRLVRAAIGPFALDRVRVYSDSEERPCAQGFYSSRTGDVAIHRDILTDRHETLLTLIHEAAHRVGHRGGGRWLPIPDYHDRTRGFEHLLSDFAAQLLGYLADGSALPDPADLPEPTPTTRRRAPAADDPAVPASRRELAHLLLDQLPHALTAGGFASEKALVASTAVHPDYWRTLTHPKTAGHRQQRGGRAWDYDKVALLAEATGIHPPVVWLGYHLCEGAMHGRTRQNWGKPGPWAKKMREEIARACTDLEALGGAYAQQIPALQALACGKTPAPTGEDSWQAPARALVALERQRLGLDGAHA